MVVSNGAFDGPMTNAGRIAERLRAEIIERRIGAGDRLAVTEIARRFGTSGAPVREALQQLGAEGFLQLLPNRGAVARIFGPRELRQVFSIREALEAFQAGRFTAVATSEQLDALQDLAVRFEEAIASGVDERSSALNRELHTLINAHDDNAELLVILERHRGVARMMRHDFGHSEERSERAAAEHFALIEALRRGDAHEAARIAGEHVRGTLDDILACYAAGRQARAGGS